eukprot:scaffold10240_cov107-Isochrysis_galbana.AAC.3
MYASGQSCDRPRLGGRRSCGGNPTAAGRVGVPRAGGEGVRVRIATRGAQQVVLDFRHQAVFVRVPEHIHALPLRVIVGARVSDGHAHQVDRRGSRLIGCHNLRGEGRTVDPSVRLAWHAGGTEGRGGE